MAKAKSTKKPASEKDKHPRAQQMPHIRLPSESLEAELAKERNPAKLLLKLLGPGLVTGASDDDPSGIATYAQGGAALGVSSLWTALFTFPMMWAVQLICAKIGMVTGTGLVSVLRKHYSRWLLYPVVLGDTNAPARC